MTLDTSAPHVLADRPSQMEVTPGGDAAALQQIRTLLLGGQQDAIQRQIQDELSATRRELAAEITALRQSLNDKFDQLTEAIDQETVARKSGDDNNGTTVQNTIELLGKSLGEVEGRVGTRIDTLEQRAVNAVRTLDTEIHGRVETLEGATLEALQDLRTNKLDASTLSGLFGSFQGQLEQNGPAESEAA